MIDVINNMLGYFKWYRRYRRGAWYRVWEVPYFQGGFIFWTHSYCRSITKKVLDVELYP